MSGSTFLTRVKLQNYKSIGHCNVELGPLTFLVGPNGAGKSNFLDALRFVSDALSTSLDQAIRQRNGINEVRRRSNGHPNHFSARLELNLSPNSTGHYSFRIGARPHGGFEVQEEECYVRSTEIFTAPSFYRVHKGIVTSSEGPVPAFVADRLYLVAASGLAPFRPVFDAMSHMAFYNLNPAEIREPQRPDAAEALDRDGFNVASILRRMSERSPRAKARVEEFLASVVPGLEGVDADMIGPYETLVFRQQVAGSQNAWRFPAASMSDGTLRALGVLVALFQGDKTSETRVPLIGIEEPEVALHPAAVGSLIDGLDEASETKQILITSHSPDLLDSDRIDAQQILSVVSERGVTHIGPINQAARSVIRDRLYTPGELLRQNQLAPDPAALASQAQLVFFNGNGA